MVGHSTEISNRLINETSPYLLQHARNPVDWYPWGEAAFARAKREDKPIFLSIGYSSCHWCHVMAHEVFEDEEVAACLNRDFVSIKVDKEERPDVDAVYMLACQMMTGQGGWPLSILMTPEQKPFFAATFLPKQTRQGLPGMLELLPRTAAAWRDSRSALLEAGEQVVAAGEKMRAGQAALAAVGTGGRWTGRDQALLDEAALTALEKAFDTRNGGFGDRPKFPTPHHLLFLLGLSSEAPDVNPSRSVSETPAIANMVRRTLEQMFRGGIHDHAGGGFARYSTDERWLTPHFEKMLYDNALLTMVYATAAGQTGDALYRRIAETIVEYVRREMTDPAGAFYSAQDADSQGEEGAYYTFSKAEVQAVLGDDPATERFCKAFDVSGQGNFEGRNILHLLDEDAWREASVDFREQLGKLRDYRSGRMFLHRDDKVLVAWNGMMIAALAVAGRWLAHSEYTEMAGSAARFVQEKMTDRDGRLCVSWRQGSAGGQGGLDEYAWMAWGLAELHRSTGRVDWREWAVALCRRILSDFTDEAGGFYMTGMHAEPLIWRPKEVQDGALPSGNSVALMALVQTAAALAESDKSTAAELAAAAERQRVFLGKTARRYPLANTFAVHALRRGI